MMREESKVTHAFFQMGSLDSYMLKHTFACTLESEGISGNVGASKWVSTEERGQVRVYMHENSTVKLMILCTK